MGMRKSVKQRGNVFTHNKNQKKKNKEHYRQSVGGCHQRVGGKGEKRARIKNPRKINKSNGGKPVGGEI